MKLILLAMSFNGLLFSNSSSAVQKDKKSEEPKVYKKQVTRKSPVNKNVLYIILDENPAVTQATEPGKQKPADSKSSC